MLQRGGDAGAKPRTDTASRAISAAGRRYGYDIIIITFTWVTSYYYHDDDDDDVSCRRRCADTDGKRQIILITIIWHRIGAAMSAVE